MVVSNCSDNYGPYHFPEKLIPLTILNALAGRKLPIYGKGENIRDWIYVDDHARALDIIIKRGTLGEAYNVGVTIARISMWCCASAPCWTIWCRPTAPAPT